eukprot:gene10032-13489_t
MFEFITDQETFLKYIKGNEVIITLLPAIIIGFAVAILVIFFPKKQTSLSSKSSNFRNNTNTHTTSSSSSNIDDLITQDYTKEIEQVQNDSPPLRGSTEKYDWFQSEHEVELFVKLPKDIISKLNKIYHNSNISNGLKNLVKVDFKLNYISVLIDGNPLVEGKLYSAINPSECTWQLEGACDNDPYKLRVWIVLFKKVPTTGKLHWKSAIIGDKEVSFNYLLPDVYDVDTNDPNYIKDSINNVSNTYYVL